MTVEKWQDVPVELPCGDSVLPRQFVGQHLGGERLVECSVHNRKFIIKITARQIVEFEVKEAP